MTRTATLTFLLSDVEGSTRLAQQVGEERFVALIGSPTAPPFVSMATPAP